MGFLSFVCFANGSPIDLLAGYDFQSQLPAVEGLIYEEAPIHNVLRLIVLAHICDGNINSKTMEQLKRDILQVGATPSRSC